METWQILVTVGVPSGIFGFAVWLIERKIEQHERKRTEEAKKRENIEAQREKSREELQICIYETSLAAIALGEATAKAVQRILTRTAMVICTQPWTTPLRSNTHSGKSFPAAESNPLSNERRTLL